MRHSRRLTGLPPSAGAWETVRTLLQEGQTVLWVWGLVLGLVEKGRYERGEGGRCDSGHLQRSILVAKFLELYLSCLAVQISLLFSVSKSVPPG